MISKDSHFFSRQNEFSWFCYWFCEIKGSKFLSIKRDNSERKIYDSVFVPINIYNANTEPEQLHTLNGLINILETLEDIKNKRVVLGGDFNVLLNPLDSEDASLSLKRKQ